MSDYSIPMITTRGAAYVAERLKQSSKGAKTAVVVLGLGGFSAARIEKSLERHRAFIRVVEYDEFAEDKALHTFDVVLACAPAESSIFDKVRGHASHALAIELLEHSGYTHYGAERTTPLTPLMNDYRTSPGNEYCRFLVPGDIMSPEEREREGWAYFKKLEHPITKSILAFVSTPQHGDELFDCIERGVDVGKGLYDRRSDGDCCRARPTFERIDETSARVVGRTGCTAVVTVCLIDKPVDARLLASAAVWLFLRGDYNRRAVKQLVSSTLGELWRCVWNYSGYQLPIFMRKTQTDLFFGKMISGYADKARRVVKYRRAKSESNEDVAALDAQLLELSAIVGEHSMPVHKRSARLRALVPRWDALCIDEAALRNVVCHLEKCTDPRGLMLCLMYGSHWRCSVNIVTEMLGPRVVSNDRAPPDAYVDRTLSVQLSSDTTIRVRFVPPDKFCDALRSGGPMLVYGPTNAPELCLADCIVRRSAKGDVKILDLYPSQTKSCPCAN